MKGECREGQAVLGEYNMARVMDGFYMRLFVIRQGHGNLEMADRTQLNLPLHMIINKSNQTKS